MMICRNTVKKYIEPPYFPIADRQGQSEILGITMIFMVD